MKHLALIALVLLAGCEQDKPADVDPLNVIPYEVLVPKIGYCDWHLSKDGNQMIEVCDGDKVTP